MAFGIDDALMTAAAGISLADTVVKTIKKHEKSKKQADLELLLNEVRITALQRIDEADLALVQLERMLIEKGVDIKKKLSDVIAETPTWKPFEKHRLSRLQKTFNAFCDNIYCATDDIAALVRCFGETAEMGAAVVESAKVKHDLHSKLLNAPSLKAAIDLLRKTLVDHKHQLSQ